MFVSDVLRGHVLGTANSLLSSIWIASDEAWPSWPSPGTKLTSRVWPEMAMVGLPPSATFTLLMR